MLLESVLSHVLAYRTTGREQRAYLLHTYLSYISTSVLYFCKYLGI